MNWVRNTDPAADRNSYVCEIDGRILEVFTGDDEQEWCYRVGEGETVFGFGSKAEAIREAEIAAKQHRGEIPLYGRIFALSRQGAKEVLRLDPPSS